ncbi:hypothetical protein ELQ90_04100 [Labedella phragmitis]|uniref:Uncharacterized protein n=1 Tax=Labedella phragmitis TaxID=2498849 RepID=A0A3S3ZDH5_9MICO|nr:hypothetical protein ELQ90_04100 [Labedella phragmitis]
MTAAPRELPPERRVAAPRRPRRQDPARTNHSGRRASTGDRATAPTWPRPPGGSPMPRRRPRAPGPTRSCRRRRRPPRTPRTQPATSRAVTCRPSPGRSGGPGGTTTRCCPCIPSADGRRPRGRP